MNKAGNNNPDSRYHQPCLNSFLLLNHIMMPAMAKITMAKQETSYITAQAVYAHPPLKSLRLWIRCNIRYAVIFWLDSLICRVSWAGVKMIW